MRLKLIRLSETTVTRGTLLINDYPEMNTLEPPWLDNLPDVSCIPAGEYRALSFFSIKHGPTFKLVDVPNRSDIEFHEGNDLSDTKGCILLGFRFGMLNDKEAILSSLLAMKRFRVLLDGVKEFTLRVVDAHKL